ncbi:MAG: SCO family protein [Phycisphaerales bacterium]
MQRLILPIIVVAAVGLVLSIVGLVITAKRISSTAGAEMTPDPAVAGLRLPEFVMRDQAGAERTHELFEGRVTVLDFTFTHCPFACPIMTLAMQDLASELRGTAVRFASISVDPVRDTPARLTEYAREKEIDLSRWTMLTGDQKDVERIVMGSLQFALAPDPERTIPLPDGTTMQNITHPTRLILIGPGREVLGMYDPNRPEEMATLSRRARRIAETHKSGS